MFELKVEAGEGGADAAAFAHDLAEVITKSTGVRAVDGTFCL